MPTSPLEVIIGLLATAMGDSTARTLVLREAKAAGLENPSTQTEAAQLLARIEALGGSAGLAARLARSRLERGLRIGASGSSTVFSPSTAPQPDSVPLSAIAGALARSLGDAKAEEVVSKAAAALGFTGAAVTNDQAVRLLESLVVQGGVVATVARFAKVRFLLDK